MKKIFMNIHELKKEKKKGTNEILKINTNTHTKKKLIN